MLLRERASVEVPDNDGLTPLYWACSKGNDACVKALLHAGASLAFLSSTNADTPRTSPLRAATDNDHRSSALAIIEEQQSRRRRAEKDEKKRAKEEQRQQEASKKAEVTAPAPATSEEIEREDFAALELREEERRRRERAEQDRARRANEPERPLSIPGPSGPLKKVPHAEPVLSGDALAKRTSRKQASIDAATQHELELREREELRKAELMRMKDLIKLGSEIGQGG